MLKRHAVSIASGCRRPSALLRVCHYTVSATTSSSATARNLDEVLEHPPHGIVKIYEAQCSGEMAGQQSTSFSKLHLPEVEFSSFEVSSSISSFLTISF